MKIYVWISVMGGLLLAGCSFTQKVKTGMQAYEVKQYAVAAQMFQQEYEANRNPSDKPKLAFYAGESFSRLNDQANAAKWYATAAQDGFGPEAKVKYADALKRQEKYEEAIVAYEELLKASPGNAAYRSGITVCKQAIEWKKNKDQRVEITRPEFNTSAAEYSPQPIGNGKVLFTSDRESNHTSDTYLWTGRSFSDLYIYTKSTHKVELFDSKINSPQNDGTAILSPNGNILVFTRCYVDKEYDAWCKLMMSAKRGDEWSEPVALSFQKEKTNYGQPAFAANGTTLFFSSDVEGGLGEHDLYYTQLNDQGEWTEPISLGSMINTAGEEVYPTVYKDTLYYSSDHLAGLGGLDIFKTYLDQNDHWVPPINLRAPINSGGDDFGFVVDTFYKNDKKALSTGYFTSSRGGVSQMDDIYAYTVRADSATATKVTPVDTAKVEKPINYQLFLVIKVVEPVYQIKDDPNSGKLENRILPNGPVIITEGALDQRMVTDAFGEILFKLDWNKTYTFTARYRDHLASSVTINTAEVEKNPEKPSVTLNRTLVLDPIFKNKEIVLENIFYDYDQWAIREDAKPSLNALSAILKTNPNIRIQLTSHTDCRGTDEYNLDLSQKRAQAAIDYLVSTGIQPKRMEAVGMGESALAVNCVCENCTEAEHQKNRRTTFKIID
ncbi:MAG TPA: OmpA family protein [Saprospiraceae bacterium]|nr:OmpA family protein [Saprospiraceae bacterium]